MYRYIQHMFSPLQLCRLDVYPVQNPSHPGSRREEAGPSYRVQRVARQSARGKGFQLADHPSFRKTLEMRLHLANTGERSKSFESFRQLRYLFAVVSRLGSVLKEAYTKRRYPVSRAYL